MSLKPVPPQYELKSTEPVLQRSRQAKEDEKAKSGPGLLFKILRGVGVGFLLLLLLAPLGAILVEWLMPDQSGGPIDTVARGVQNGLGANGPWWLALLLAVVVIVLFLLYRTFAVVLYAVVLLTGLAIWWFFPAPGGDLPARVEGPATFPMLLWIGLATLALIGRSLRSRLAIAGLLAVALAAFFLGGDFLMLDEQATLLDGSARVTPTTAQSATQSAPRSGADALLAVLADNQNASAQQKLDALLALKQEMGAEEFHRVLLETPTQVLIAFFLAGEDASFLPPGLAGCAPSGVLLTTATSVECTFASASRVYGLLTLVRSSAQEGAPDASLLWLLAERAIAIARQAGSSTEAQEMALDSFRGELGEQLYSLVLDNIPVQDPDSGEVITLRQYGDGLYDDAVDALTSQAGDSLDAPAMRNLVDYLQRADVPWDLILVKAASGQAGEAIVTPLLTDESLAWAARRANVELGLSDRDIALLVATTKFAMGLNMANPGMALRSSVELLDLAEEDYQSADSRLRPALRWALAQPVLREVESRYNVDQKLTEADLTLLREGLGDVELLLRGDVGAWRASADTAVKALEAAGIADYEKWTQLASGDFSAARELITGIDVDTQVITDYFANADIPADIRQRVGSALQAIPDLDPSQFEVPQVDMPRFDLSQFDLPEIDLPDIEMPRIRIPSPFSSD